MKQLVTASDWSEIHDELLKIYSAFPTNRDANRLIHNLDKAVSELSRLSVIARRNKSHKVLDEPIKKINQQIAWVEDQFYMKILKDY
jgi:hypothetical protein